CRLDETQDRERDREGQRDRERERERDMDRIGGKTSESLRRVGAYPDRETERERERERDYYPSSLEPKADMILVNPRDASLDDYMSAQGTFGT
ncbi:hypothetical protein KIPB_014157, partial [Kipferlia bialata]